MVHGGVTGRIICRNLGLVSRSHQKARMAGLLLAGGRSSRFGSEKAVARFQGRPMMAFGAEALLAVCEAAAVSARAGSGAAAWAFENGWPVLADDAQLPPGPLAGVAAGIAWAKKVGCERLLTLPCDAPLVSATELRRLIDGSADGGAVAVTFAGPEPLVAIWPVARFPEDLRDHPPIHRLLRRLAVAEIRFARRDAFHNVNFAHDLAGPNA